MEPARTYGIASINAGTAATLARSPSLHSAVAARLAAAQSADPVTPAVGLSARPPATRNLTPAQYYTPLAQTATPLPPPAPSTRELAAMAQAVYTPGAAPPTGWAIAGEAQLAALGLTPEMLSSPTSEFRAEVYVRTINGQPSYTLAFRGSQSGSDWRANLQQGVGLESDHYNRALEIGRRLDVPQGARVTITGHSLGGGLASAAALAAEMDATTFNAAGLSDNTLDAARAIAARDGTVVTPDINAYFVRGEVLSALQDGGDRVLGLIFGGIGGALLADLPPAVGTRIALDPVRPDGMRWYQDNPVAKHMMDYVLSSLDGS